MPEDQKADKSDKPPNGRSGKTYSNWALIKWMGGLALAHPWRCLFLLTVQSLLLTLVLSGLSLTKTAIDVLQWGIRHKGSAPTWPWGFVPPAEWTPYQQVLAAGVGILGFALVRSLMQMTATLATGSLIQAILTTLRTKVYDKLQRLSFRYFDAHDSGTLINRATVDVSGVASFAELVIINVVMLAISLVAYFVFMLNLQPTLALVSLTTTPLLLIASVLYSRMVRPGFEKERELRDRLISTLAENVQGQHVVKGFALEGREMEKFRQANDECRQQQRWLIRRGAAYGASVNFFTQLNLLVVLTVGGSIIILHRNDAHPAFTIGGLVAFASILNRFSNEVASVANISNMFQRSLTAAGRVYDVLQTPLEIQDGAAPKALPRAKGAVRFENVSFGYNPEAPVLMDISFEVKPGQCVAILGATGSGKSTLLSLLPRFYDPTKGRIFLDGVDVRDLRLDDLRRNIGMVFQESFLFSNTVAANIAFGHPTCTREQVEKAARIAQAHDFIMEFPDGYDTVIGEQGSTLSGGQRQRLALARAILLEPAILLLDDATAAIDPETESEIMAAMESAAQGRTTFVIAHRLSTLRRADHVLVLEQGRIVQAGRHEELIRRRGHYAEVAKMQVADPESLWIIQAARWDAGEIDSPLLDAEELQ